MKNISFSSQTPVGENQHQGLQHSFLNALRENSVPIFIYLVNGVKLHGVIEAYDSHSVLLQDYVSQLVFKHAISTIVPQEPFEFPSGP